MSRDAVVAFYSAGYGFAAWALYYFGHPAIAIGFLTFLVGLWTHRKD